MRELLYSSWMFVWSQMTSVGWSWSLCTTMKALITSMQTLFLWVARQYQRLESSRSQVMECLICVVVCVQGYNSPHEFIATQGPLPETRNDFWKMVLQQKSHIIVMLTQCNERRRVSSHGNRSVTAVTSHRDGQMLTRACASCAGEVWPLLAVHRGARGIRRHYGRDAVGDRLPRVDHQKLQTGIREEHN